jgi:hypothetical protein
MDIGQKPYSITLKRRGEIDDLDSLLLKDWRAGVAIGAEIVEGKAGSDTRGA